MADRQNWWTLTLADPDGELSDADREHIAEQIRNGFIEGQVVADSEPESEEAEQT